MVSRESSEWLKRSGAGQAIYTYGGYYAGHCLIGGEGTGLWPVQWRHLWSEKIGGWRRGRTGRNELARGRGGGGCLCLTEGLCHNLSRIVGITRITEWQYSSTVIKRKKLDHNFGEYNSTQGMKNEFLIGMNCDLSKLNQMISFVCRIVMSGSIIRVF